MIELIEKAFDRVNHWTLAKKLLHRNVPLHVEKFLSFGLYLNVYSLYCNPDLDDRIFDCLLASMAAVQAEDIRASFLFVGDLNGHHQEWLGSTTTNRNGVAALDFARVTGCDQLVGGHVVEHLTS